MALQAVASLFDDTAAPDLRRIVDPGIAEMRRGFALPRRPTSPVLRTKSRDAWIGWTPEAFVERVQNKRWRAKDALRALMDRIEGSIEDIRFDDLATDEEIANPTERVVFRLEQKGAGAAVARERQLQDDYSEAIGERGVARSQTDPAKRGAENVDWHLASTDLLFVRKRAYTLARLLDAKRQFRELDWSAAGLRLLEALMGSPAGYRALGIALQEVRKDGLSSQIADLSVCGAVAPYNLLLGGKLVLLYHKFHLWVLRMRRIQCGHR